MKSHNKKLTSNRNGLAMRRKKYLPVALALAAFATVGSAPAFAQADGYSGSPLQWHYDNTGGKVLGMEAQTPSITQHRTAQSSRSRTEQSSHSRTAQSSRSRGAPQG